MGKKKKRTLPVKPILLEPNMENKRHLEILKSIQTPAVFIDYIRSQMLKQKIGVRELAKKAGITPRHMSSILRKKRNPSNNTILKIASAIGVNPPELLLLHYHVIQLRNITQELFENIVLIDNIIEEKKHV